MPQYARRSTAALVMCDVTRKDTMTKGAKIWKKCVDDSVSLPNGQPIPCVLLVNKVSNTQHCTQTLILYIIISCSWKKQHAHV